MVSKSVTETETTEKQKHTFCGRRWKKKMSVFLGATFDQLFIMYESTIRCYKARLLRGHMSHSCNWLHPSYLHPCWWTASSQYDATVPPPCFTSGWCLHGVWFPPVNSFFFLSSGSPRLFQCSPCPLGCIKVVQLVVRHHLLLRRTLKEQCDFFKL